MLPSRTLSRPSAFITSSCGLTRYSSILLHFARTGHTRLSFVFVLMAHDFCITYWNENDVRHVSQRTYILAPARLEHGPVHLPCCQDPCIFHHNRGQNVPEIRLHKTRIGLVYTCGLRNNVSHPSLCRNDGVHLPSITRGTLSSPVYVSSPWMMAQFHE
ncbi:hypothetical protein GY45DRAFT_586449 [Cubamyces sp. BRFM 1775]|nr:hypothetical protein GY45DRAFT_586449 [Cubamyces sp. BRFM 1775]